MTNLKRTDRSRMRAMNTKLVLDAVRAVETTSQADLIKATKLSTGTIVSIVRDLRALGLLVQAGKGASRGGRCPTLLKLNTSAAVVLSCQVGSDTATVCVLDLGARVLSRRELVVEREHGPAPFMEMLVDCLRQQLHELFPNTLHLPPSSSSSPPPSTLHPPPPCPSASPVAGLGLSLHGPVDAERGVMLFSEHLGWRDVPFKDELEKALGVPVFAEAETRAIALAEQCWGAAGGARDFVLIELDTGIGMVQVLDGKLCRGSHNLAGELGFTAWESGVDADRRTVVLEQKASLRAICREAVQTSLVEGHDLAEETILQSLLDLSSSGDPQAQQILDTAARVLGMVIANVINLLDPERILLTGRLVSGPEGGLLDPIRQHVQAHLVGARDRVPRIEQAVLGADAALLGAARLVSDHFFSVDRSKC